MTLYLDGKIEATTVIAGYIAMAAPISNLTIGLENIGLDNFVKHKLPDIEKYQSRLIVNFFGDTTTDYVEMASALSELERVDALEMN